MPRRVIFEGGIARVVDETIVSEAPIEAMMPFLERTLPTFFPVMPDHTRVAAYNPDTKRGGLLIELVPVRRNLRCAFTAGVDRIDHARTQASPDHLARFNVQLPYQYFYYGFTLGTAATHYIDGQLQNFTLDTGLYFWRNERLTNLNQPLWRGQIWNVDENSWICWGGTRHTTESLAERIDDMVLNFASTTFNLHLGSPHPVDYANYTAWERASEDPLCYTRWTHWPATRHAWASVNDLFNTQLREAPPDPLPLAEGVTNLPLPPERFTVGRALEWMEQLPEPDKNRFLHALLQWAEYHPEEELNAEPPAPEPAPADGGGTPDPARNGAPTAAPDRRRRRQPAAAAR